MTNTEHPLPAPLAPGLPAPLVTDRRRTERWDTARWEAEVAPLRRLRALRAAADAERNRTVPARPRPLVPALSRATVVLAG